jgi:hypothetical protein
MENSIERTIQRTRQYWYIDGFGEILTSVILILLAVLNAISGLPMFSSISGLFISIGYPLIVLIGVIWGRKLVKTLKEKFTFPRTGYIQYIQPAPSIRRKKAITAGMIAFAISFLTVIFTRGLDDRWLTLGTGLIFAAFLVYFALQIPLNRFYWLAAWAVAISIFAGWLSVDAAFQTAILLGGIGLGWLVSGLYALKSYMDNTQSVDTETGEI